MIDIGAKRSLFKVPKGLPDSSPAGRGTTLGSPPWGSFLSTRYHRPAHRTGGRYYFTYKTGDLESYHKDFFFRRKEIKCLASRGHRVSFLLLSYIEKRVAFQASSSYPLMFARRNGSKGKLKPSNDRSLGVGGPGISFARPKSSAAPERRLPRYACWKGFFGHG
jgi:hypothetical protein